MNQSFQNIFEKYNIISEVPSTRFKAANTLKQSHTFTKKQLEVKKCSKGAETAGGRFLFRSVPNTRQSSNFKPSCYFNTNTKGKYFIPTRYKTLDIIGLKSVHKNSNRSIPGNEKINVYKDGCSSQENCAEQNFTSSAYKVRNKLEVNTDCLTEVRARNHSLPNIATVANCSISDCTRNCLSDKTYTDFEKQKKLKSKVLNDTENLQRESFHSFESSLPKPSNTKDSFTVTKPGTSTELDLLIDLIEREEKSNVEGYKQTENKPCFKGGYEELFERALKREKVKSNFLKYDKKIGLRSGQLLTVVQIESLYGFTLATVKSEELNKNFSIAVAQEMAPRLKLDAKIEAFFDVKTLPYKLQLNGEWLDVYLEPYKILIV